MREYGSFKTSGFAGDGCAPDGSRAPSTGTATPPTSSKPAPMPAKALEAFKAVARDQKKGK